MPDDPLQRRADRLVERVDALAEALRAGGVSEEASAELLSQASSAVLQALRLELLVELGAPSRRTRRSRGRSCGRGDRRSPSPPGARGGAIRGSRSFSQSASLACTCTSIPTRSTSSHGPIGQPAPCFMPASRSAGVTRASSSTRTQSFRSGIRIRLTTKPGVSWQRIGRLPSRSPSAYAASNASSDVRSARTISTSGMRGAGLKKCIPTTRSGVEVAPAISVTESAEVFVASTASGRQTRSSSASSSRFGPSSSTIASITTSQSANAERSVVRSAGRCRRSRSGPSRPCA